MTRQLMPEILKLSTGDRIALADAIYESVDDDAMNRVASRPKREHNTMLPGQKAELERRIAYYEAHPNELIPAEKVLAKLKRVQ